MARPTLLTCLAASALSAACYGKARPTPTIPDLPEVVPGASVHLDVDSDEELDLRGSRARWVKNYRIDGMSYDGKPVTYGQVRALVDPSFQGKLAEHRDNVRKCRRANVPRYIGYASVVAGIGLLSYGGVLFKDKPELQMVTSYGAMGVGALSYATGYLFFGGRACSDANEMYEQLRLDQAGEGAIYNDALVGEIGKLVEDFNRRMEAQGKRGD